MNVGIKKLREMQFYAFNRGNFAEVARIRRIAQLKQIKLHSH